MFLKKWWKSFKSIHKTKFTEKKQLIIEIEVVWLWSQIPNGWGKVPKTDFGS